MTAFKRCCMCVQCTMLCVISGCVHACALFFALQVIMEIYYSSLPATLKTVMAKNKEKMDHNVSGCFVHYMHVYLQYAYVYDCIQVGYTFLQSWCAYNIIHSNVLLYCGLV